MREGAVDDLTARLAVRLASWRSERAWSMDDLAARSGVSRSTLSRIERGETQPTAAVLNQLCAAYGTTLSRLFGDVEQGPPGVVRGGDQQIWTDPSTGFVRRCVSPPHPALRAEVVDAELPPGAVVEYDRPPVPGLEHHVWVRSGRLAITLDGAEQLIDTGDCLRYRLTGPSVFRVPGPDAARYTLVLVLP